MRSEPFAGQAASEGSDEAYPWYAAAATEPATTARDRVTKQWKRARGMTLIELMVVFAIIAILLIVTAVSIARISSADVDATGNILSGAMTYLSARAVHDNTYYAELLIRRGDDMFQVDARPSDSIALALRLEAPIFAAPDLLDDGSGDAPRPGPEPEAPDAETLKRRLERLDPEDFGRFAP